MQTQTNPKLCSVEGCNRPRRKREWCHTHYEYWRRHGTVERVPRKVRVCSVKGCGRKHWGQGYCSMHLSRLHRHGDLNHERPGHRMTSTATYRIWAAMWTRCTNPHSIKYARYGGRGIEVCERWRKFENFLEDMGERPPNPSDWKGRRSYWSIDRINADGNYEPSNCRWATQEEQMNNLSR